jgi:hypothetical protein
MFGLWGIGCRDKYTPTFDAQNEYPFSMMSKRVSNVGRFLATLAMVLQALLPGTLAVAESQGVDVSRFVCAPSGEFSPQSRKTAERLAALFGDEPPDDEHADEHCPLCTLSHTVLLIAPVNLVAPIRPNNTPVLARYSPGLVYEARGPPLGSRGPPSHN